MNSSKPPTKPTATIEIMPHVSMWKKTGEINYSVPAAIADLADNTVDALKGAKAELDVQMSAKEVLVDGADAGMSLDQLRDALRLGLSSKRADRLGCKGMGLKSAAAYMGQCLQLTSAKKADKVAHMAQYSESDFLKGGTWEVPVFQVDKPFPHGTRVRVLGLKVQINDSVIAKTRDHLGRVFKRMITDGTVKIKVNGVPVNPIQFDVDPKTVKSFEFDVKGMKVRGWAGKQNIRSNIGQYGFDLLRNGRVIKMYDKIGLRRHPSVANIVGEIDVDPEFPVATNKTDFIRDNQDWNSLVEEVTVQVKDLMRASARKYTKRASSQTKNRAKLAAEQVTRIVREPRVTRELASKVCDPEKGNPIDQMNRVSARVWDVRVEHDFSSLGIRAPYMHWKEEDDDKGTVLRVVSNMDHPSFQTCSDAQWLARHAMAEAIVTYLFPELKPVDFLQQKDTLLRAIEDHVNRRNLGLNEN